MKILYLSCHGILEYDEMRMFSDMGIKLFSAGGAYQYPGLDAPYRPMIPSLEIDDEDIYEYMNSWYVWNWNQVAPKKFIDRFDAIYVMAMPRWIYHNWESFKHKPVIYRTIGQSNRELELELRNFRKDKPNIKIVRYSPLEKNIPNYAGEDAMIRFGKRPDDWKDWNGNEKKLTTVVQSMKIRKDHCAWNTFEAVSTRVPCKLYGGDNPDIPAPLNCGSPTYQELKKIYQDHRAYFSAGTKPASYTLNFMEAWMTGIPIIALGDKLIQSDDKGIYEVPRLIKHGETGFIAENPLSIIDYTNELFNNDSLAKSISEAGRKAAIDHFDESKIVPQWKEFFKTL